MKFRPGDIITRAGQPGDGAYLIVSGPAGMSCSPGSAIPAEPVEPGSLIGEMAMLIEHDYGSTVVARDRVLCLKITRAADARPDAGRRYAREHFQQPHHRAACNMTDELRQIDSVLRCVRITAAHNLPVQPRRCHRRARFASGLMRQKKSAQPRGRSWAQEARHAQVPGGKPAPQAMSFG